MSHSSIQPADDRVIKSWFGFFLGLICVVLSLVALCKNLSGTGVMQLLGFLCFWYPWTQMQIWNQSIKHFFKVDDTSTHPIQRYLTLMGSVLLIAALMIQYLA